MGSWVSRPGCPVLPSGPGQGSRLPSVCAWHSPFTSLTLGAFLQVGLPPWVPPHSFHKTTVLAVLYVPRHLLSLCPQQGFPLTHSRPVDPFAYSLPHLGTSARDTTSRLTARWSEQTRIWIQHDVASLRGLGTENRCQYGTILLNFSGDSALSAGCDSLSFNFESGGMHRVCLREPVPSTSASGWAWWGDGPPEHVETDDDKSSLDSD